MDAKGNADLRPNEPLSCPFVLFSSSIGVQKRAILRKYLRQMIARIHGRPSRQILMSGVDANGGAMRNSVGTNHAKAHTVECENPPDQHQCRGRR
jgi:hypothetical protein